MVWHYILGVAHLGGCNCDVRIMAIYGVGKLVGMFCFITCKVLAAEWHGQHGWT